MRASRSAASRRGALVKTTAHDVYLFWAKDEDNGGEEVVVAFDNFDVGNDPKDLWRIVRFDSWVQFPNNFELIRGFVDVVEARATVHGDGMVLVPFTVGTVGVWKGVIAHGHDLAKREITKGNDPRIVKMIGIPQGWEPKKFVEGSPLLPQMLNMQAVELPEELKEAEIIRAIVTDSGGLFLVVRLKDGENGCKILGRLIPHYALRNGHVTL